MLLDETIKKYPILDVTIHSTGLKNLESKLEQLLVDNHQPKLITTFNLDFLRLTTIDNEFKYICKNSLFNLPDGYGIVNIIKKKYNEKVTRITGTDIYLMLINLSKKLNKKTAIIGAENHVSKKVEEILINQHKIKPANLLCISPEYKFEENVEINKKVINTVKEFKPDIVFAALGCPRQEKWLYQNMNTFGSKINIGIGATLDFFTNEKKRSPDILQTLGLEWLWRLVHEPKRLFKRYIIQDLPFFIKMMYKTNYEKK